MPDFLPEEFEIEWPGGSHEENRNDGNANHRDPQEHQGARPPTAAQPQKAGADEQGQHPQVDVEVAMHQRNDDLDQREDAT